MPIEDWNSPVVIVTIASAISGLLVAGITAFAKAIWWLAEEFKDIRRYVRAIYDEHEVKDEKRHEDNIVRFAVLETKLDTVIQNGAH